MSVGGDLRTAAGLVFWNGDTTRANKVDNPASIMRNAAGRDPAGYAPAGLQVNPLPASSPRLRNGRYEVAAFGPKNPVTTGRRCLSGPHRFADLAAAQEWADRLDVPGAEIITIDRTAPANSRYPQGPWRTYNISVSSSRPASSR